MEGTPVLPCPCSRDDRDSGGERDGGSAERKGLGTRYTRCDGPGTQGRRRRGRTPGPAPRPVTPVGHGRPVGRCRREAREVGTREGTTPVNPDPFSTPYPAPRTPEREWCKRRKWVGSVLSHGSSEPSYTSQKIFGQLFTPTDSIPPTKDFSPPYGLSRLVHRTYHPKVNVAYRRESTSVSDGDGTGRTGDGTYGGRDVQWTGCVGDGTSGVEQDVQWTGRVRDGT